MINQYLNASQSPQEANLVEDLIDEAIQIYADTFYYIPKQLVSVDNILNEDRLKKFKEAYEISGYLETSSLDGNGYMLQKFGNFIDQSATVTFSKKEWERMVGRYGKTLIPNRPNEGDCLYYPTTDGLFEIVYCDDKSPFAQFGRFYTFKCTIELYQYNNEQIETGMPEIDVFESYKTLDSKPERSLWGGISEIEIEDPGRGYVNPPEIIIHSLTGHGANIACSLNVDGGIDGIEIIDSGNQYASTDWIEVIGDCDKPAKLIPKIQTIIEHVGDQWGANEDFTNAATTQTVDPLELFGPNECV